MFYVYEHWRPDTGLPFYVGKGCGDRAYTHVDGKSKKRGNRQHIFICRHLANIKQSVEVRIVFNFIDESTAFELEKSTISYWRSRGVQLVNRTDGGEGVSMRSIPSDVRAVITANISAANKVKWDAATREKLSKTNKRKWKDDLQFREKMTNSLKNRWDDPGYCVRMCAAQKKSWSDPEVKKRRVAARQTPESRLKVSSNSKKAWQDPEIRKKMLVGLEKAREARRMKRKN